MKPVRINVSRSLIAKLLETYPHATSTASALSEHLSKTLPKSEALAAQGNNNERAID
jgi:hypothetical protein